jgi:hypothetical protein
MVKLALDATNQLFDGFGGDWPFSAGDLDPAQDFVSVECFPSPIFFDYSQPQWSNPFVRGESPFAILALSTTTDASLSTAGIYDARISRTTKGTLHDFTPLDAISHRDDVKEGEQSGGKVPLRNVPKSLPRDRTNTTFCGCF